jgi:hypothetical protein
MASSDGSRKARFLMQGGVAIAFRPVNNRAATRNERRRLAADVDMRKDAEKPAYKATPTEKEAVAAFLAARGKKGPRLKVMATHVEIDHPDLLIGQIALMKAIGTTDGEFLEGLLTQLANAGSQGPKADERGINFILAVVKGIEPRDQIEAMLAAQMAAVHNATMTFARRLAHVDNIPQQDSAQTAFNKLARTFAAQVEALKRYRSGGEQKMTVQHVHVAEGGQAIVGSVNAPPEGAGARKESRGATTCTGLCTRRCGVMRHRRGAGSRADRQP